MSGRILFASLVLIAFAGSLALAGDPYSVAVLQDGPVGYWRLDEAPGATLAEDLSGNDFDLVLTGFDAGQFAQPGATLGGNTALRFRDAKGGSLREDTAERTVGDGIPFASGQSFSFEYWVRFPIGHQSSGDPGILGDNYDQNQNQPWYMSRLTAGTGGTKVADIYLRGGGNYQAKGVTDLEDDAWHHIVGMHDGVNHQVRLYVDGVLEGTAGGVPTTVAYGANADSFILGQHLNRTLDAWLDEVAMYDKALDDVDGNGVIDVENRVLAHFQAASVPEPSALALAGLGLAGAALCLRRRRRARVS